MPVTLGYSALNGVLQMADAIRLVEEVLSHEAAGRTIAAPKLKSDFEGGAMRILFAADYEAGYGATKASHRIKGAGVPAAADLASVRRPVRELRAAEKPSSRRRDSGS